MKSTFVAMVAVLLLFNIAHAERTVWYVHPDSTLNTIQAGLNSCADNDIVLVGPGTYYENIDWPNTQGIHLVSEFGPGATIIDGNSVGTVITCSTAVDNTTMQGFTIQNGNAPDMFPWGAAGGVHVDDGSVTVTGNNIINNLSSGIRGAVSGASSVTNNTISSNTLNGVSDCHEISNNIITHNTQAGIRGGNSINNYIAYNYVGIFSPCSTYGNVITHNTSLGIGGGEEPFFARGDTITYNGTGIRCYGYMDSCLIAYNYGDGVRSIGDSIKFCNIFGNGGYGVVHDLGQPPFILAEHNWWGNATGPYHPDSNPGGMGDSVSDFVDFTPWLTEPVGVKEKEIVEVERRESSATICSGPLRLPEGKNCRVFDITGRVVEPDKIQPGIYFIEVDNRIAQKVIKIR